MGIGINAGQRAQNRAAFRAVSGSAGGLIRSHGVRSSYSGGVQKAAGIGGVAIAASLFATPARAEGYDDGASGARAGVNCMKDASPEAQAIVGGGAALFMLAFTVAGMIVLRRKDPSE